MTASPRSPTHHPAAEHCLPTTPLQKFGVVVCRIVIPLWLIMGPVMKLQSMNPKLLPPPVLAVIDWAAGTLGVATVDAYDPALRVIVLAEIAIALAMAFAPRLTRFLAVSTLGLFCVILGLVLLKGADSCGCFGESGPPPWAMLLVDGALLVGAIFLPLPACRASAAGTVGTAVAALIIGAAVATTAPGHRVTLEPPGPPPAEPSSASPTPGDANPTPSSTPQPPTPPASNPPRSGDGTPSGDGTSAAPPQAATQVTPWPPPPTEAKPYYDAVPSEWVGKRLDAQEVPLLLDRRTLKVNPNQGRMHVVFIREDCEHCHEMLEKYFSLPKLDTPTLLVVVPDATGSTLDNPCVDCSKASLLKGPIWMFTTPLVLTVEDGVVLAGIDATKADDPEAVRAVLNARKTP